MQADWLRVWHERLDLASTPLYDAWPMCKEALREHSSSHMFASLASMAWIPADSDRMIHAINQSSKPSTPPWQQPMPWDRADTAPKARAVDRQLRARLNERLGLAGQ